MKGFSQDVFYQAIGAENRSNIHFCHASENLTEIAYYPKIKHKKWILHRCHQCRHDQVYIYDYITETELNLDGL